MVVPAHGTTRRASDELVDVPVSATFRAAVDLPGADWPVDVRRVDRSHVYLWMGALEIPHGAIRETLRDCIDEEIGCTRLECVIGRL